MPTKAKLTWVEMPSKDYILETLRGCLTEKERLGMTPIDKLYAYYARTLEERQSTAPTPMVERFYDYFADNIANRKKDSIGFVMAWESAISQVYFDGSIEGASAAYQSSLQNMFFDKVMRALAPKTAEEAIELFWSKEMRNDRLLRVREFVS